MDKCQGIFGKLFGHSYRPAITRGSPSANLGVMEGSGGAIIKVINSTRPETYHGIYCKRCGKVING
ncbi:TPA: hypothetical protein I4G93_26430 [Enterobacter hormaechei subsp. xiangfangensis]|uniref:Uncharacterized protein n=1 Tax=Enterobacter hormaechei subsp. xiangfangensis TaxID=1296536 RepID=A0A837FQW4_9ENTR|nr:hypothetical protein SS59_00445 [Enterobacter hormaechei subsp. xiangfangensis]HAS1802799.1 hypothetical protein [Enterobacter hormaechei subsp. xiangfangensis]HAS1807709.1 hypothetical protein [Enterobacter hormaechei subsp. xiangfangensis]HAS1819159.1 hypothetical protein [Enterobacter hormaechei subsp. xiangfangensis]HAS1824556.1 hypothetical protein [Enterobacter hormaechei subsp. xiangfangensis]